MAYSEVLKSSATFDRLPLTKLADEYRELRGLYSGSYLFGGIPRVLRGGRVYLSGSSTTGELETSIGELFEEDSSKS